MYLINFACNTMCISPRACCCVPVGHPQTPRVCIAQCHDVHVPPAGDLVCCGTVVRLDSAASTRRVPFTGGIAVECGVWHAVECRLWYVCACVCTPWPHTRACVPRGHTRGDDVDSMLIVLVNPTNACWCSTMISCCACRGVQGRGVWGHAVVRCWLV